MDVCRNEARTWTRWATTKEEVADSMRHYSSGMTPFTHAGITVVASPSPAAPTQTDTDVPVTCSLFIRRLRLRLCSPSPRSPSSKPQASPQAGVRLSAKPITPVHMSSIAACLRRLVPLSYRSYIRRYTLNRAVYGILLRPTRSHGLHASTTRQWKGTIRDAGLGDSA